MATKILEIADPYDTIPVRQLIVGSRLPCDIFIKEKRSIRFFLGKDVFYTKISQDILKEKDISEVYIYVKDIPDIDFYLSRGRLLRQAGDEGSIKAFKKYSFNKEQFHQVDTNLIMPGSKINFGLYAPNRFNFSPLIEASDESPAVVDSSIFTVAGDVVIKKSDLRRYREYIGTRQHSPELPESDKLRIKALALKEMTKVVLQDFFADPGSGEKMKEIKTMVNHIIECIMNNRDVIYTLLSLKGYDYYTYTHSVNVAALSVGLGIAIDLKPDDIEKLGVGAILHDIGKSVISHEILNKQGQLSDVQFNIFKNHVLEGEKIMRAHKSFPEESFSAVMQHHEKLSGKGYPNGLSGGKILLFGRISAIADYYDVLTTRRYYKVAYQPFQALLKISGETGNYDSDLLITFIKILGKMK